MDDFKKKAPHNLQLDKEVDGENHPFALPLIIDIESLLNRSLAKASEGQQHWRHAESCSSEIPSPSSQKLSNSFSSSKSFATHSSSIKFPDIFSNLSSPDSYLTNSSNRIGIAVEKIPSMVSAFDFIIYKCVNKYVELSFAIDQDVFNQANQVLEVFRLQRHFLLASVGQLDPDNPLSGTGPKQASKIKEIKQIPRVGPEQRRLTHLKYIAETVGILGWVVAGSKPNDFIREIYNQGKHHADEVQQNESLNRQQLNYNWVRSWKFVVTELDSYVMRFHPDGLKWQKS